MQSAETNPTDMNPNEITNNASQPRAGRRVTWIAATRGDFLLLGPVFMAFKKRQERGSAHWLLDTGEVGMAACQARDWLGLTPDETAELCHPADEPALRLSLMLERSESFIRRRKGSHIIFSGFGPTAAATAIYCHARGCRGLWLRPPDPAGVVGRLRWESGLERMIRACAPCVDVWQIPGAPDFRALKAEADAPALEVEIPGLRPATPLVIIAALRRDWGYMDDATAQVAKAAAAWAKARPKTDFLIISNLNARLEGPVRSLPERPSNLLLAPPLPYPVYNAALERAHLVVTDAPLIVAEAMGRGVQTATLGDLEPAHAWGNGPGYGMALTPGDLGSEAWAREMTSQLDKAESGNRATAETAVKFGDIHGLMREVIEEFLAR